VPDITNFSLCLAMNAWNANCSCQRRLCSDETHVDAFISSLLL
jgi:hypothetical protein